MKFQLALVIIVVVFLSSTVSGLENTATSTTTCQGNTCTTTLYGGLVNYYVDGSYVPINSSLTSSTSPEWDYETTTGAYSARYKTDPTAGLVVLFEKDGYTVGFQPMALNYRNDLGQLQQASMIQSVMGLAYQNKMVYTNAYGNGVDLSYTYWNEELKEDLVVDSLASLPLPDAYILAGGNPTLDLDFVLVTNAQLSLNGVLWDQATTTQTRGEVLVTDGLGHTVYTFKEPVAIDAEGNTQSLQYEFKKSSKKLYVTIKTPWNWLQNATYPIHIDPTITLQTPDTEVLNDVYVHSGYPNTNFADRDYLLMDSYSISPSRGYIMFDITSIPNMSTITEATLGLYIEYNLRDAGEQINISANAIDDYTWNESTMTWNTKPDLNDTVDYNDDYSNGESDIWMTWNVTHWTASRNSEGYDNISYAVSYNIDIGIADYLRFTSKEGLSNRPFLNVTYVVITVDSMQNNNSYHNNETIELSCNATTISLYTLQNITLYGDFNGTYQENETNEVTGLTNTTSFNLTLPDGIYHYAYLAKNNNSDSAFTTNYTFTIDTIKPTINLTEPVNNSIHTNSSIDLEYSISDTNIDTCWYVKNEDGIIHTITDCENTTVVFGVGNNNLTLYVNDSANNTESVFANFSVTTDTDAPVVTFDYPTSALVISSSNTDCSNQNLSFNYSILEYTGIDTCLMSLSHSANGVQFANQSLVNCTNTTFMPTLGCAASPNHYTISLYTNDTLGNNATYTVDFLLTSSVVYSVGGGASSSEPETGICEVVVASPTNQQVSNLFCPASSPTMNYTSKPFRFRLYNNDSYPHTYDYYLTGLDCATPTSTTIEGHTYQVVLLENCSCPPQDNTSMGEFTIKCSDSAKSKSYDIYLESSTLGRILSSPYLAVYIGGLFLVFIIAIALIKKTLGG